ncbi:MAG: PilZ domain-containing protein [Fimbriimonadales bacterium]
MDATTSYILSGMTGCPVDLVLYDDGNTRLLRTEIASPLPLRLKVLSGSQSGVRAGRRVMLLACHEGLALRGDGHLDQYRSEKGGLELEIGSVQWELLERRRHVRVPLNLPVTLRAVAQGDDEPTVENITGTTMDISVSGAFVKAAVLPDEGSLVEFTTHIQGEELRTLAVVAHVTHERSGVGLHFVEYLGNSRHLLREFLTRAA